MGLGGTAKKLQKVVDMADDLYRKLNELKEQLDHTLETVEETNGRVETMERDLAEQRRLIEALAEDAGIDVEDVGGAESDDAGEATVGTGSGE